MTKEQKMLIYLYENMQELLETLYEIESALKVIPNADLTDEILELRVVQSILNVSRSTLFKLRKQGKIKFDLWCNKAFVSRSELRRYLKQNKTINEDELQQLLRTS